MSSQNILKNIAELSEIVNGWQRDGYASHIERDIALVKARNIYELIRFIDMPCSAEELTETTVAVDLEDILINDIEDEKFDNIEEQIIESNTEVVIDAIESKLITEKIDEPIEPYKEPEVPKDTLFDLDAIPKNTKSRRSAILSLYGYDEDVKPAKVETEHEKIAESKPQYVEVMLFDDPIQQPQEEKEEDVSDEPMVAEVVNSIDLFQSEPIIDPESCETPEEERKEESELEVETKEDSITNHISLNDITATSTVVGDVINSNIETISDHYITEPRTNVVMEQYENKPIKSISASLGINERYLLARDLFDGDAVECNKMIESLEDCESYDDAIIYIAETYMWNADSQGAQMVMNLLERKFNI